MPQIRKVLRRRNRQKRRGWYSSGTFTAAESAERRGLTPGEWDELHWYEKHRVIAYYRALDTTRAWEQFLQERELEKRAKKRGR